MLARARPPNLALVLGKEAFGIVGRRVQQLADRIERFKMSAAVSGLPFCPFAFSKASLMLADTERFQQ